MLRWLLLLTTLLRMATASSPWWCAGEELDSMPEGATEEEIAAMLAEQKIVEQKTRTWAQEKGKGPLVTEKLVEAAKRKVRDESHDRVHLRQMQGGDIEAEEAELVPIQAMMPAGVVARMLEKEQNRG